MRESVAYNDTPEQVMSGVSLYVPGVQSLVAGYWPAACAACSCLILLPSVSASPCILLDS